MGYFMRRQCRLGLLLLVKSRRTFEIFGRILRVVFCIAMCHFVPSFRLPSEQMLRRQFSLHIDNLHRAVLIGTALCEIICRCSLACTV